MLRHKRRLMLRHKRRSSDRSGFYSGAFVVLAGPDGSGKSTVAATLSEIGNAEVFYWRPGLLPMLRKLSGRRMHEGVNADPHGRALDNPIKATLRSLYYGLDFVLGSWFVVGRKVKSGKLVVADRWVHDMVVDPARYGLRSARIMSVVCWLCRPADLLVVLRASPSVILARKAELSESEIWRQYSCWGHVKCGFRKIESVSTNSNPGDSAQAVLELLVDDGQVLKVHDEFA